MKKKETESGEKEEIEKTKKERESGERDREVQQNSLRWEDERKEEEKEDDEGEEDEEGHLEQFLERTTNEVYVILDQYQRDLEFVMQVNAEGFSLNTLRII